LAFRGEPEGDNNGGGAQGDGDPSQLVEAAGIPGDLCLPEDHDQDRRAEDAAELAAAVDHRAAGGALLNLEECLRLEPDSTLDKPYPPRSKALFHSHR